MFFNGTDGSMEYSKVINNKATNSAGGLRVEKSDHINLLKNTISHNTAGIN